MLKLQHYLLITILLTVGLYGFSQELLPGDFSKLEENTIPKGWETKYKTTQIHSRKLEDGKNVLTLDNSGSRPDWRTISYTVDIDPSWDTLFLSGKVTISDMKPGKEKWNIPCIMPNYTDANGKKITNYDGVMWKRDGTYKFRRTMKIPTGAVKLKLTAGFYGGNGIADFEKISLKVIKKKSTANFRALEKIEPEIKQVSAVREEILLNGVWKFKPELKGKKTGYGYIRVPGIWAATHRWMIPAFAPVPDPPAGSGWKVSDLKKCYEATYEKTITVPESWKDHRMILSMDRVSSQAEVWVDDKKTGTINWPYGTLDIAEAVTPGKPFKLRLEVKARPRNITVDDFTFYTPRTRKGEIYNRGLGGTVVLTCAEKGPLIDGMFIKTSVRKRQMDVDVELDNKTFTGNAGFQFTIKEWPGGKPVKKVNFTRKVNASSEIAVQNFKFKWSNPKLWDINQPNLYTLEVAINTPKGNDALTDRFGFREIRFQGRHILLNEKPVRFRLYCQDFRLGGTAEILKESLKIKQAAGFNLAEISMNPRYDQNGSIGFRKEHAGCCDEAGFCLMMPTIDFNKLAYHQCISDKMAKSWNKEFKTDWKRFRNHPSIVLIVAGFNRFDTNIQRSPLYIGNRERLLSMKGGCKRLIDSGNKVIAVINKIDPTRPATSHSGSGVGNFHSSNIYLNFIPLQEREAWLSAYAQKGDMPYCAVEFGPPISYSYYKGREVAGKVVTTEPMVTEWSAIYLGGRAFELENEKYRAAIADIWWRHKYYATWKLPKLADLTKNELVHEMGELFVRNTWRSWRTVGIDGGMVPWSHALGWSYPSEKEMRRFNIKRSSGSTPIVEEVMERTFNNFAKKYANKIGKTLIACNQPYLVYIAGKPSNYTTKDHHFYSGGKVEKQIAIINDSRKNTPYSCTCLVKLDGKDITNGVFRGKDSLSGTVDVGKTLMVPVRFRLPEVSRVSNGTLLVKGTIADTEFSDSFAFTIFPPEKNTLPVMVYDRTGKTAAYVARLGFKVQRVYRIPTDHKKVLIVGENNMSRSGFPWKELDKFVKNGGRVLIMTDKAKVFRERFGFRLVPQISRRVFPMPSLKNEPLSRISPELMRDWTGSGKVVPETFGLEGVQYQFKSYKYGFHWGNVGSVSSVPLEKPHASGWTPLFESEFSLAYSPLLELRLGKGLLQLTTFDFVSRTARDPGSERLFSEIIKNLANTKILPIRKTFLVGATDRERSLLKKMTLEFTGRNTIPDSTDTLLIAGSELKLDTSEFRKYVENGGHAVVLPRGPGEQVPGFSVKEKITGKNTVVPNWLVLRGVSLSDLFLKTDLKLAVLTADTPEAETGVNGLLGRYTSGKGEAVFIQLLPYMLNEKKRDYLKFPAWRWTRLLAQILSNSGAVFKTDREFLTTNIAARVPVKIKLDTGWRAEFERKEPKVQNIANRLKDQENKGEKQGWHRPGVKLKNWRRISIGNSYQAQSAYFSGSNGVIWYRTEVMVPKEWKNRKVTLCLGIIDDMDTTYFNGHRIGCTDGRVKSPWSVDRKYPVNPAYINYGGKNVIAVRCFDNWSNGGIMGHPFLRTDSNKAGVYHLYCDDYDDGRDGDDVYRYCNW